MAEYRITHVHLGYGASHESHIQSVWLEGGTRPYTVDEIISLMDHHTFFYSIGGGRKVRVAPAISASGNRFIKTVADETLLNNLLHLPRF